MENLFDIPFSILHNRDMKVKKIKCEICGDTIKGRKCRAYLLKGKNEKVTMDIGCFFMLKERGLIAKN